MTDGDTAGRIQRPVILRRIRMLLWVQASLGVAAVAAHLVPLVVGIDHLLLPARSLLGPGLAVGTAVGLLLMLRRGTKVRPVNLLVLASLPVASILLVVRTSQNTAIGWVSYGPSPDAWRLDLALRSATIAGWLSLATLLVAVAGFGSLCLPATRSAIAEAKRPIQH